MKKIRLYRIGKNNWGKLMCNFSRSNPQAKNQFSLKNSLNKLYSWKNRTNNSKPSSKVLFYLSERNKPIVDAGKIKAKSIILRQTSSSRFRSGCQGKA